MFKIFKNNELLKTYLKAETLTLGIFIIGVFIIGILISYFGLSKFLPNSKTTKNDFSKATPAPLNNNNPQKGVYNVLLMGYGGGNHDGTYLTDSMIVIHVDTNIKKASMISIPRDLWVPGGQKLNAIGVSGFQNTMPVITSVTGLPINYYVSIDFSSFTKLVDNLGGITVSVPKTFDDPFYPIEGEENNTCGFSELQINTFKNQFSGFELEKQFTCRYEHLHFDGGTKTNLDGATALKFTRSRHGDSDFGRSQRQFAVLQGIADKLISLRSLNKLDQTVSTLFNMVKTDLDLGTIKSLSEVFLPAQAGGEPSQYKVNQIQLTSDNVLQNATSSGGAFILIPKAGDFNFSEIKSYINSNL